MKPTPTEKKALQVAETAPEADAELFAAYNHAQRTNTFPTVSNTPEDLFDTRPPAPRQAPELVEQVAVAMALHQAAAAYKTRRHRLEMYAYALRKQNREDIRYYRVSPLETATPVIRRHLVDRYNQLMALQARRGPLTTQDIQQAQRIMAVAAIAARRQEKTA